MNNFKFIRINPKYMEDKYKYEDELTGIIFEDLFNIKIKYLDPVYINFYKREYLDNRWEKILTLIYYQNHFKDNYFYIDHDTVINPKILNENSINATFGPYGLSDNKLIASFIDLKIINKYKEIICKNKFILKDINNEEILLKRFVFENKKLNIFKLPMNQIHNLTFQMHYKTNFIYRLIIQNEKIKNKKYLLKLVKNLRRLYEKKR